MIITGDVVKKSLKDMGVQTSPYLKAKLIYENQKESIYYVNGRQFDYRTTALEELEYRLQESKRCPNERII